MPIDIYAQLLNNKGPEEIALSHATKISLFVCTKCVEQLRATGRFNSNEII